MRKRWVVEAESSETKHFWFKRNALKHSVELWCDLDHNLPVDIVVKRVTR
jgi:hypothetical protein